MKGFDFLATVLVNSEGGNWNGGVPILDGMWICLRVVAGVIAGATGIGYRSGLRKVTIEVIKILRKNYFPELLEVCTVDPPSINFEIFFEPGATEGELLFPGLRQLQNKTYYRK